MLGSESGSNVFDWDGTLQTRIAAYRKQHPRASDRDVYNALIAPLEMPGLMNQVSPRVFEAIACRTPLVLFDGRYSDVFCPDKHFIPLRRDGSNMKDVISRLRGDKEVDAMVERAYADVLASGRFGHRAFVRMVDDEIAAAGGVRTWPHAARCQLRSVRWSLRQPAHSTTSWASRTASRSRWRCSCRCFPEPVQGFRQAYRPCRC